MSSSSNSSYKLVLLGDGRVGKTSLVSRFAENRFSPTEESTLKAQMYKRARLVIDGRPVDVSVWDTAGQERFHALGPLYYRGADGAVLVYDITDGDSFVRVRQWVKELKKTVGDDISLVLCGNKCDLVNDRVVSEEEANKVAERYNASHFYTSAKADTNVQAAFTDVIERAVRRRVGSTAGGGRAAGASDLYGGDGFGGGGGGGDDASPAGGRKKRRGLVIDDGSGGADFGSGGGGAVSSGPTYVPPPDESEASPTAPPPRQRGGAEEPPRSVRVTLREDEEAARNGARPPRAAPAATAGGGKPKKKSEPCCGK